MEISNKEQGRNEGPGLKKCLAPSNLGPSLLAREDEGRKDRHIMKCVCQIRWGSLAVQLSHPDFISVFVS